MIADHSATTAGGDQVNLGKWGAGAGMVGIIGVVILAAFGMFTQNTDAQQQVMGSYLYGLVFWVSISVGMLGLTILNHAVRSTWTLSVLRILEAGGGWVTLLVMGACFLPIMARLPVLYTWAEDSYRLDPVLVHKHGYLNPGFFIARWLFFFALWAGYSWFLRNSSMKQERTKDFKLENGRMSWGAAGLPMIFLTGTFAFIDWVMSLEPKWYSTMYGLWYLIGSSLGGYALAVLVFNLNIKKQPFASFATKAVGNDQGNMLFVHTMLWAYTSLSQYLILWNGNLPETTSYYARRASFGWNFVGLATIFGQFAIPFFSLLSPRTKKNPKNLASIAAWMFCIHIVDYTLIVAPALPGRSGTLTGLNVLDAISWLAFGALWLAGFSYMAKQAPAFPTYDTRLQEAKAHAH